MGTAVMSCLRGALPNHLQTHQYNCVKKMLTSKTNNKNHQQMVEGTHHYNNVVLESVSSTIISCIVPSDSHCLHCTYISFISGLVYQTNVPVSSLLFFLINYLLVQDITTLQRSDMTPLAS